MKDAWRIKARPVEPIRKRKDIQRIREYFLKNFRHGEDYDLFWTLGINFGLRASDIRELTHGQLNQPESFEIVELKTGKQRTIYINASARAAFKRSTRNVVFAEDDARIIDGQKGRPIEVKHMHKLIKMVCKELRIEGNFGSHTMRKTFAYHAFRREPTKHTFELIKQCFDHSTNSVTRIYTGEISDESEANEKGEESTRTIRDVYLELNL